MAFALIGALLLLVEVKMALASCNSTTDGTVQCVTIDTYSRPQWATCLKNTYIQQVSKGEHICQIQSATYCYYQCQIEVHNEDKGDVFDDCACQKNETAPPLPPLLEPSCYSPSGENCTWYSNCLEKRYPCQGGQDGYAVDYAEHFCNRYETYRREFSNLGERWMNAVRKCLQVALAPALRPFEDLNCTSLKARAFDSHEGCYLRSYQGALSVCDLPTEDWWSIFLAIAGRNEEYVSGVGVGASLYRLYKVFKECRSRNESLFNVARGTLMTKINATLPDDLKDFLNPQQPDGDGVGVGRRRRQASNDSESTNDSVDLELRYLQLAQQVGEGVAAKLGWAQKGLVWFAFADPSPDRTSLTTSIMLADQRQYGLLPGNSSTNLTSVALEFAEAFQSGRLNGIRLDGTLVQLLTMSVCEDADCQQVALNATAPTNAAPTGNGNMCEPALKMLLALLWMAIGFHGSL